jgi:hypothetical protein
VLVFEKVSRIPVVVFATKRGRKLGCGVPRGVVEVDEAAKSVSLLVTRSYGGAKVPFSGAFGGADAPGAFGTENLANDTGLNVDGRFTELLRA